MILDKYLPVCASDILVEKWISIEDSTDSEIIWLYWPIDKDANEYFKIKMKPDATDILFIPCMPEEIKVADFGCNKLIALTTLAEGKIKSKEQVVSVKQIEIDYGGNLIYGQNLILLTNTGVQIIFRFEDDSIFLVIG